MFKITSLGSQTGSDALSKLVVNIGKQSKLALLDTGGQTNLIDEEVFHACKHLFKVEKTPSITIVGVGEKKIPNSGSVIMKDFVQINGLDPMDFPCTITKKLPTDLLFGIPMLRNLNSDLFLRKDSEDKILIRGTKNGIETYTKGDILTNEAELFTATSHRRVPPKSGINLNVHGHNHRDNRCSGETQKIKKIMNITVLNKTNEPAFISKNTAFVTDPNKKLALHETNPTPIDYCECRKKGLPETEQDAVSTDEALKLIKTGTFFTNEFKRDGVGAKDRLIKVIKDNIDTAAKFRFDMGKVDKSIFIHDVNVKPTLPDEKRFQPFKTNSREKEAMAHVIENMEKYGVMTRNKPSPYSNPAFTISKADTPSFFSHGDEDFCKKCKKIIRQTYSKKSEKKREQDFEEFKFEYVKIQVKGDGNCLYQAAIKSNQWQAVTTFSNDAFTLRQNVAHLGELISDHHLISTLKLPKEVVKDGWRALKEDKKWATDSPIEDFVILALSEYIETPILLLSPEKIEKVEGFFSKTTYAKTKALVMFRSTDHFSGIDINGQTEHWEYLLSHLRRNDMERINLEDAVNILTLKLAKEVNSQDTPSEIEPKQRSKPEQSYRLLVQSKWANMHTETQAVVMPSSQELLQTFGPPNKVYGSLDIANFYWQIPVTENYSKIYTVATHLGTHSPESVQQGDASACAAGMNVARKLTYGIKDTACLLDDIAIAAVCPHSWIDKLEEVLKRMRAIGEPGKPLKYRPDKLTVLSNKISFLGFVVEEGFLKADPKKIEKAKEWAVPKTVIELMSFLGFVNFFRDFIDNCSSKCKTLIDLSNNSYDKLSEWTDTHQKDFEVLKNELQTLPKLKIIDTSKNAPMIHIYHDASKTGYGGIVGQQCTNPKTGRKAIYPVYYFSRLARGAEKNYKMSEAEMNSLTSVVKKYRYLLRGRQFVIHSDSAVVYFTVRNLQEDIPCSSSVIGRLATELNGLSFQVNHISTKKNPTDYFSRCIPQEEKISEFGKNVPVTPKLSNNEVLERQGEIVAGVITPNDEQISEENNENMAENSAYQHPNQTGPLISIRKQDPAIISVVTRAQDDVQDALSDLDTISRFIMKQKNDKSLKWLYGQIKRYGQNHTHKGAEYTIQNSILKARSIRAKDGKFRYALPQSLERDIILQAHRMTHSGVNKTIELVNKYYIQDVYRKVSELVKKCATCQIFDESTSSKDQHMQEIQHIIKPRSPMDVIAIDIFSVGENHGSPYNHVIAAIDLMSRHVFTRNLKQATSENIASFLIDDVFRLKIPRKIISDNAENITGGALPHLYKAINLGWHTLTGDTDERICHVTSTPHHSMGNAVIERFFRTFKSWLKKLVVDKPEEWHNHTGLITFQYNNSIHRGVGNSPNFILYGIKPKDSKPDIFQVLEEGSQFSISAYIQQRGQNLKEGRELAKKYSEEDSSYMCSLSEQFHKDHRNARKHSFQIGEYVLAQRLSPRDKFDRLPPWQGPAEIIDFAGPNSLVLKFINNGAVHTRNASQIKRWFADKDDTENDRYHNSPLRNTNHTHHSKKPEKDSENEDDPEATTQILDKDLAPEMEPETEVEEPKDDDKDEETQNVNFDIPTTNSNLRRSERMNRGTISKYGKYYVH